MASSDRILSLARDPQLARLAFADSPAWLWSADGSRVIWCNAAGAAVFGAMPPTLMAEQFGPVQPARREIAALFGRLPAGDTPQLARLRAFSPSAWGVPLTCSCRRWRSVDGASAILVVAAGSAKPRLSLAERVRRTIANADDLAAFAPDGTLIHAGASSRLIGSSTLEALVEPPVLAAALREGHAIATTAAGHIGLTRFGEADAPVLVARLEDDATASAQEHQVARGAPTAPCGSRHTDEFAREPAPTAAEPSAWPMHSDALVVQAFTGDSRADTVGDPELDPKDRAAGEDSESAIEMLNAATARLIERRHPLRFVWAIDLEGRFTIEPGEFTELVGQPTLSLLGCGWEQLVAGLNLDPDRRLRKAIVGQGTWSGLVVEWPAGDVAQTLPVALSGLPVLGADRRYRGYRGFGVCRDIARISGIIAARRERLTRKAPTTARDAPQDAAQAIEPPLDLRPPDVFALPPHRDARANLALVPAAKNVVPLRTGIATEKRPALNSLERNAFREIARALGARVENEEMAPSVGTLQQALTALETYPTQTQPEAEDIPNGLPDNEQLAASIASPEAAIERTILDRLPIAVLVFRGRDLLFANRALLEWTGMETLEALATAGGPDSLFVDSSTTDAGESEGAARTLSLRRTDRSVLPVEARLFALKLDGNPAVMLVLTREERHQIDASARRLQTAEGNANELRAVLDAATDGVVIVGSDGRVLSANRGAEALFGYDGQELAQRALVDLLAPESRREAATYVDGLSRTGVPDREDGREVIGQVRQGGPISLLLTMRRVADDPPRFCAVFRDLTRWKQTEDELTDAKRQAEKASSAKSEFLAQISHEIRTPLNAIVGFSEVMMEERLGPIGNDRYHGYAKDIHAAGTHMVSLLNDLLDLSKIEAGRLDLALTKVNLNDIMQQCVAIMQPQAHRERIIIRSAMASALPTVMADARSVRQILLNLLSNSIKFTGAGGQIILSTALTDAGEVVLRVRDTGIGMSESDIATALEPFRQLPAVAKSNAVGTGLGLPLTKALAEANRAEFRIKSAINAGTLVEVVFPAERVIAE